LRSLIDVKSHIIQLLPSVGKYDTHFFSLRISKDNEPVSQLFSFFFVVLWFLSLARLH